MKSLAYLLVYLAMISAASAQDAKQIGAGLFRRGDFKAAISVLETAVKDPKFKRDAEVWYSLGLAYLNTGASKKARGALEQAVAINPDSADYRANLAFAYLLRRQHDKSQSEVQRALQLEPAHSFGNYIVAVRHYWEGELDEANAVLDKVLLKDPTFGSGYILKSEVFMSQLGKRLQSNFKIRQELDFLRMAAEILETGRKNVKGGDLALIAEKLEPIKWFYDFYSRTKDSVPTNNASSVTPANVKPLKILYQPAAEYTDDARNVGATGAVRLAIHLGENGKVLHILKLWGIGYGLDEEAIKAAKAIRFEPKTIDGKPVSVVIIREYTFHTY